MIELQCKNTLNGQTSLHNYVGIQQRKLSSALDDVGIHTVFFSIVCLHILHIGYVFFKPMGLIIRIQTKTRNDSNAASTVSSSKEMLFASRKACSSNETGGASFWAKDMAASKNIAETKFVIHAPFEPNGTNEPIRNYLKW